VGKKEFKQTNKTVDERLFIFFAIVKSLPWSTDTPARLRFFKNHKHVSGVSLDGILHKGRNLQNKVQKALPSSSSSLLQLRGPFAFWCVKCVENPAILLRTLLKKIMAQYECAYLF
jgi:hypothetical protein